MINLLWAALPSSPVVVVAAGWSAIEEMGRCIGSEPLCRFARSPRCFGDPCRFLLRLRLLD
jgi:hypothetical protein